MPLRQARLKIDSRVMPIPYAEVLARYLGVSPDRLRRELMVETEWGTEDIVAVSTAWLEVAIDESWMSAARLAVKDGRIVITELRVFPREREPGGGLPGEWTATVLGARAPAPRGGGITKDLLRRVPMGEASRHFRALLRAYQGKSGQMGWMAQEAFELAFPAAVAGNERPRAERGTGRPDWFFAQLASDYCDAIERGTRKPVAELAARRRFPPARIRAMLHEARERGLLSRSRRGVLGGELTTRAREVLKQRRKSIKEGKR